jgi:hypothetical protein
VAYTQDQSALLDEWATLMRSSGWWFPFDEFVVMCERHKSLSFDADHRLHCESGPAIECRDDYKVYAWHGTRIPAEWIESPDKLTAKVALTMKNSEQRRAACEIIGWTRIIAESDVRVVDEHEDPMIGTLLDAPLLNDKDTRYLRVRCGTGREFVLRVPATCTTALQAQAWVTGLNEDELIHSEVRT